MYTIGQFSRICKVSAKALRHYEKIGLLIPAKVDQSNLYRYYSREQVAEVQTILFMKDLGIPLQTVKRIIREGNNSDSITAVLDEHRKILLAELERGNNRLMKLARWRKTMEVKIMEAKKHYEITIMDVPETAVYSARKVLSNFNQTLPGMIEGLLRELEAVGGICAGAPIMLYYDEEFNADKVDIEVAWPVLDLGLANRTLPAIRAACYTYVGPYDGLQEPYEAIYAWINENNYQSLIPMREISVNDPRTTAPEQLVTTIQIPIKAK